MIMRFRIKLHHAGLMGGLANLMSKHVVLGCWGLVHVRGTISAYFTVVLTIRKPVDSD